MSAFARFRLSSLRWPHSPQEQQRLIFLVYLLLSTCAFVLFTFSAAVNTPLRLFNLTALMTLLFVAWAHRRSVMPLRWLTHVLLLGSFAVIYCNALLTGGMSSPNLIWLVMMPMGAVFLLSAWAALLWTAAVLLGLAALPLWVSMGWLGTQFNFGPEHTTWALSTHLAITVSVMAMNLLCFAMYQHQLQQMDKRNAELSDTRAALMQAESYKDQFLASVGHELRTPMNAILGFNDVLRDELPPSSNSSSTVDLVRSSTEHLLKLVNQILNFSQIQADRMPMHMVPTYLPAAFDQCQQNFATPLDSPVQFIAQFDAQLPPWVITDAGRLKDVLCHLIDNAFKFTSHGSVTMRVGRDGQWLLFEVIDTGVGIAPDIQTHIFNRFEHASQESHTKFGGTGLGLAICKGLVALFGGEIGLQSTPLKGSRFWFKVPLVACDPPSTQTPLTMASPKEASPLRLMVVDDNPVNLKVAQLLCQKIWPDAVLHTAMSGAECLALLPELSLDALLLDLIMPGMDGLDVTRTIRKEMVAPLKHLPIIGLTASSHPNDHAACRAAGMNAVVLKPINKLHLEHSVLSVMGDKAAHHG